MDSALLDALHRLEHSSVLEKEQNCSAATLVMRLCSLLSGTVLASGEECVLLYEYELSIRQMVCTKSGGHQWEYDNCGYWGHVYCVRCLENKYPELSRLSCREAIETIGSITESEYTATKDKEGA